SGTLMPMHRRGAHHGRRIRYAAIGAVAAVVVLAASCSGDGGDDSSAMTTTTSVDRATSTTAAGSSTTEVADPYPDFTPSMHTGSKNWLCHPDIDRAECTDQPETVVAPDLATTEQ